MIQLDKVYKKYPTRHGQKVVLNNLCMHVERGQHVGIMGRNGSGKSTLIRLIAGVEMPTSGSITRGMSISFPLAFHGAFQPQLTGLDNLKFVSRIYGKDYKQLESFVEEFSELGSYMREPLRHYSSGMRARLAFALSMAIDFDCFLIDEIIAVGDSRFHDKCRVELFEKRRDRALILVSHDFGTIQAHCNRVSVLVDGFLHSFDDFDSARSFYR